MSGTQDKIRMLNTQIDKLKSIEKHFRASEKELADAKLELEKLEHSLHNEYTDIESLEKLTLKGVFHSILGDKEKQLEKARQEYLQIALKHSEVKTTIETLEYELKILKRKSDLLRELETELQALLILREKELQVENSPQGEQLRVILARSDELVRYSARLEEIHHKGKIAIKKLSMAILALQEAKNWGNWDMMHKRRRQSDYFKHSAIDDAKQLAFDAKRALIAYERELEEIHIRLDAPEWELGNMSSFLDIFFDNLITDWIFQQKIKKTLVTLKQITEDVRQVQETIESSIKDLEKELSELLITKEKILID